eukprot:GEMP01026175.1.p1 GENE.GEMP01026175.1~~GEMP01026175.1.p1  ORF type:complete len:533 (-),score=125.03 GEMP01026175.1:554-2152(-)
MGKSKRKAKQGAAKTTDTLNDAQFARVCQQLALKYAMYDKEEWWWIMDESVQLIGERLQRQGYCAVDHFIPAPHWKQFRADCTQCYKDGQLNLGGLVNARKEGEEAKYSETATRSDLIGWFNSETWKYGDLLGKFEIKINTLVSELMQFAPELKAVNGRSLTMIACYPGNDTRYAKHVDNDGKHPLCCKRVLTALMYINEWHEGDGGELVVYDPDDMRERARIPPLGGRVLLFWSDKRTPHEVLPAKKLRFSVTAWLLDTTLGDRGSTPPPPTHVPLSSVVTPSLRTEIADCDATTAGAVKRTMLHNSSTTTPSTATEKTAKHESSTTTPSAATNKTAKHDSSTTTPSTASDKTTPHDSLITATSPFSTGGKTALQESSINPSSPVDKNASHESSTIPTPSAASKEASREPPAEPAATAKSSATAPQSQHSTASHAQNRNGIRFWADSENAKLLQVEAATMPAVDQSDTHVLIRGNAWSLCFHGRTERIRYSKTKQLLSVYLETPCAASAVEEVNSAQNSPMHHGECVPTTC